MNFTLPSALIFDRCPVCDGSLPKSPSPPLMVGDMTLRDVWMLAERFTSSVPALIIIWGLLFIPVYFIERTGATSGASNSLRGLWVSIPAWTKFLTCAILFTAAAAHGILGYAIARFAAEFTRIGLWLVHTSVARRFLWAFSSAVWFLIASWNAWMASLIFVCGLGFWLTLEEWHKGRQKSHR